MREIKFRAWDKKTNKMLFPVPIAFTPMGRVRVSKDDVGTIGIDYEVMQYTGLIDIDEKEVYEGDILKITNPMTKNSVVKSVWWNGETARFNGIPTSLVNVFEVIGNIYENKELLK